MDYWWLNFLSCNAAESLFSLSCALQLKANAGSVVGFSMFYEWLVRASPEVGPVLFQSSTLAHSISFQPGESSNSAEAHSLFVYSGEALIRGHCSRTLLCDSHHPYCIRASGDDGRTVVVMVVMVVGDFNSVHWVAYIMAEWWVVAGCLYWLVWSPPLPTLDGPSL